MTWTRFLWLTLALQLGVVWFAGAAAPPNPEQQACLRKGHRLERAGWVYIHLEGEPHELGFQHGYLLASEIADGLATTRKLWAHQSAMDWPWLVGRAKEWFALKVDAEILAELKGMAEGLQAAGYAISADDLLAYNGWIELSDYWWPGELRRLKEAPSHAPPARQSCSSFIATGNLTADGNVVLGHNTMEGYADAFPRVIADIKPSRGHRILWQTTPGWIHSGTDFFITDAGLVGSETTIGSYEGFDTNGVPEFARMRRATQDAGSIDEWCRVMKQGNNGGYANSWLLGDVNTKEIARLELGLKQVAFEKKRDGYFAGSNIAEDPKLLRFETSADETDIRASSVARRVRWKQLLDRRAAKIDLKTAQKFEADHFDTYREKTRPSGRTLCGHYELDAEAASPWPGVPYGCAGTVDGKVVDASMAKQMSFVARWGSACGLPFNAQKFLSAHSQFDWMEGMLKDRPSQPWVSFKAGE